MARIQEIITVDHRQVVELTNADAAAISFQVLDGRIQIIRGDLQTPEFSEFLGWEYRLSQGERNLPLDDISSAVGGRVYAAGLDSSGSKVIVDHA